MVRATPCLKTIDRRRSPPLAPGDALLYGHTHLPQAERVGEHILFNPGSVSLPKGGYPASYGLLAYGRLHVVALDGGETIAQVAITF